MRIAPTKIAIINRSLARGGAERSGGLQSVLLSDAGFDVHIITLLDEIEFDYKGQLLNLGKLKKQDDSIFGRFNRMLQLRKYLRENEIDWVIDHRPRCYKFSEVLLSKFVYIPRKTIYVVHNFNIATYFPTIDFIARRIYKKSMLVAVSDEIRQKVTDTYGYQNIQTIYNPIDRKSIETLASAEDIPGKFILAYGRIDDAVKNYSLLIESYAQSVLPENNIQLYILGDGNDVDKLKSKAAVLGLSDKIVFKPKHANPFAYVKAAVFTTLTSQYEGFPMVIIESLVLGTPVVSVDCHSGPREVIQNESNGLLVENHNVAAFAAAMDRMITDNELYVKCKSNAVKSVDHLSLESISKKWAGILSKPL
jgi:glycosyltransferase involved in cell wall biosynthesis